VDVVLVISRGIEVQDDCHIVDVNTSRSNIGGCHDANFASRERPQGALTLGL